MQWDYFLGLTKPKKNILVGVLSGEIEAVGMNDYVSKPLDERILCSKIVELLIIK